MGLGIAVDEIGLKVYFSVNAVDSIYSMNLNESNVQAIYGGSSVLDFATGLGVDPIAEKIYFADIVGGGLYRMDLDGTNVDTVLFAADAAYLRVDNANGYIYYGGIAANYPTLKRCNMWGPPNDTLLVDGIQLGGFDLDLMFENDIYYSDINNCKFLSTTSLQVFGKKFSFLQTQRSEQAIH
ncbi:MAG: hypothetical protein HRT57_02150 [Crocinitomicaceae bacterium]|nr:hypothetical protein [Crocinitomicaceae bacterium]